MDKWTNGRMDKAEGKSDDIKARVACCGSGDVACMTDLIAPQGRRLAATLGRFLWHVVGCFKAGLAVLLAESMV